MFAKSITKQNKTKQNKTKQNIVNIKVDSYGIQGTMGTKPPKFRKLSYYAVEWKITKPILEELGIDISEHNYQRITEEVVKKASVVIAMDEKVYSIAENSLCKQFPEYVAKIHCFSEFTESKKFIIDPFGVSEVEKQREIILEIWNTINRKYLKLIDKFD